VRAQQETHGSGTTTLLALVGELCAQASRLCHEGVPAASVASGLVAAAQLSVQLAKGAAAAVEGSLLLPLLLPGADDAGDGAAAEPTVPGQECGGMGGSVDGTGSGGDSDAESNDDEQDTDWFFESTAAPAAPAATTTTTTVPAGTGSGSGGVGVRGDGNGGGGGSGSPRPAAAASLLLRRPAALRAVGDSLHHGQPEMMSAALEVARMLLLRSATESQRAMLPSGRRFNHHAHGDPGGGDSSSSDDSDDSDDDDDDSSSPRLVTTNVQVHRLHGGGVGRHLVFAGVLLPLRGGCTRTGAVRRAMQASRHRCRPAAADDGGGGQQPPPPPLSSCSSVCCKGLRCVTIEGGIVIADIIAAASADDLGSTAHLCAGIQ
jgi:hypothetical protein